MKTRVKITIPKPGFMRGFGKSQQFADGMKQAGYVYAADMKRRFNTFSRGGGDWAPLAESTIRGRRKGKKTNRRGNTKKRLMLQKRGSVARITQGKNKGALVAAGGVYSILQDKDRSLIRALDIGAPGNVMELRGNTLTYGIRGGAKAGAKITVGRLAAIHHNGNANLPARRILDVPTPSANDRIRDALARSVTAYIRERLKKRKG